MRRTQDLGGSLRGILGVVVSAASLAAGADHVHAQADNGYTNLQVLPADIPRDVLGQIMLDNLSGLGLPRRAGEGCLHCHVGTLDVPRAQWDYASDEKPAKEKARVMMAMVREINEDFLGRLGDRALPRVDVGCYTCHAGRLVPMPLPDLLMNEYERGGIDALVRAYRDARGRYYEGDAYDFRVSTLIEVAERVAALGSFADASVVHELNVEYGDAPEAWAGLVQLRLVEALEADGVEAMMARYRSSKEALPAHAFHAGTVDPLAWTLYRSDRVEPALALFEANFAEYPESFAANESMAYVAFDQGDEESGLGIARGWLEAHPDHEAGRQLLTELERRR